MWPASQLPCRSIKVRDSLQQPEDLYQGLQIGSGDGIQGTGLRVWAIPVILFWKKWGENLWKLGENVCFFWLCCSIKGSDTLQQQPEDLYQGLQISSVDGIQGTGLRVWAILVILFWKKWGENPWKLGENVCFFWLCRSIKLRLASAARRLMSRPSNRFS